VPKKTFYNLSPDKQDKIIQAALDEFSKEKIGEASINKIVHQAKISRGSFYTYFQDKYDLVYYLLAMIREIVFNKIEIAYQSSKGAFDQLMLIVHDEVYRILHEPDYQAFLKNVSLFFHMHMIDHPDDCTKPFQEDYQLILKYVDRDQLKDHSDAYIIQLARLTESILKEIFTKTIIEKRTLESSRDEFQHFLEMVAEGYRRK